MIYFKNDLKGLQGHLAVLSECVMYPNVCAKGDILKNQWCVLPRIALRTMYS